MGERRGKAAPADIPPFVALIQAAPIEIDRRSLESFGDLLPLAREYGLTVYDAAYVELANRRGFPLATLDGEMRRAAQQMGIDLLDIG